MRSFTFIATMGKYHIETDGEGYRAHNQEDNSVTGTFKEIIHMKEWIDRKENPPKCAKCDSALVVESVTGIDRCLQCEPFYNEPCKVCRIKRAFCCC